MAKEVVVTHEGYKKLEEELSDIEVLIEMAEEENDESE